MTNVPSIGGLLLLVAILVFIPFWTAFLIPYVIYRRPRISVLGGIIGIVSFAFAGYLLDSALWIRGIIAGVFGGAILVIALSRSHKPVISRFKVDSRTAIFILVIAGLLLSTFLYYSSAKDDLEFSINDPYGDVSYAGYTDSKLGEHENLDILKLESSVMGDSVTLEMELAEAIDENTDAEYSFYISTDKHGLWTDVIDIGEMEVDGNILRANIPVESLKDRKIFHVLAVSSEYDASVDLNLHDNCSNRGVIWGMLNIFTS